METTTDITRSDLTTGEHTLPLAAPRTKQKTEWPEAKLTLFLKLFNEGLSFSLIAIELKTTRNACIGKARRLGLSGQKGTPTRDMAPRGIGARGGTSRLKSGPRRKPSRRIGMFDSLLTPLIDDLAIPDSQKKSILELDSHTCRFPIGHPDQPGFAYCGGEPAEGSPYCAGHHMRCYMRLASPSVRPFRGR